MSGLYLAALLVSLSGLGVIDWRYRVALFAQTRRTLAAVGIAVAFFLAWDLVGVGLGIFFIGDAPYLTGLVVAPEVPVEEIFFLILLTYQALLLWLGCERWWSRRAARPDAREAA